jgi:hypothetical protein
MGPPKTATAAGRRIPPPVSEQPAMPSKPATSLRPGTDDDRGRAWLLDVSDERDLALRLRLAAWREGYAVGRDDGWRDGYERAVAEEMAAWRQVAGKAARGAGEPSFAELERRRWGPGGRDHAADPRPGDFPGRGRRRER